MNILVPERRIPVWGHYDVAVAGGGIAGVAAAVAAARKGVRTCLLEKMQVLGGLATAGNVVVYLPLCDGHGNQVSFGLAEEFIRLPLPCGASRLPPAWERQTESTREQRAEKRFELVFDPAPMMVALERLALENNVDIFFDTRVMDVVKDDAGWVTHLMVWNASGMGAFEAGAVVDATGGADVAAMAGEETETHTTRQPAGGWFYAIDESRRISLRCHSGHAADTGGGNGAAYDPTDFRDISRYLMEARRRAAAAVAPDGHLFALPTMHTFTKTRRLCGRYTLTESDVGQGFDDNTGAVADWRQAGRILEIPARCLQGDTPNLFAAGRCISSSGDAWEMTRVIPACAVSGEAAGKAAAFHAAGRVNGK